MIPFSICGTYRKNIVLGGLTQSACRLDLNFMISQDGTRRIDENIFTATSALNNM